MATNSDVRDGYKTERTSNSTSNAGRVKLLVMDIFQNCISDRAGIVTQLIPKTKSQLSRGYLWSVIFAIISKRSYIRSDGFAKVCVWA
jgi:hypothetical protein